ncbi:lytic transglycosylase domain-containing protein [Amycolatopsis sp. GM8]|uniref:lytic transglycosylase domain-containing protein n=1 Tax=Amycolatopsis sp. GM8 TaxID=2896530 RepID=UPI001F317225|nr:hypothetical protein [Amycolatopsis sp. GM8]
MSRWERRAFIRRQRIAAARRAKAYGLAAASLALVPFVGAGGPPMPASYRELPPQSIVDSGSVGVDGQAQPDTSLSPDVLAAAGNPLMLMQQLNLPADIPITPMGAPVTGMLGIPATALAAYQNAEKLLARSNPGCHLSWSLLASIGRIESSHARGGRLDQHGGTVTPILGPVLNGAGAFAAIADTDGGALDGDPVWDRAVGPMQFIPSTWRKWASDGNGDGVASPHNIYDEALAAGRYLCAGGGDLRDPQQRAQAVFRYNPSDSYVRTVLLWADAYERGAVPVADGSGPLFVVTAVPDIAAAAAQLAAVVLPPPPGPGVLPPPGAITLPGRVTDPGGTTPPGSGPAGPTVPSSPSSTSATTTSSSTVDSTTSEPPVSTEPSTTTEPPASSTTEPPPAETTGATDPATTEAPASA